LQAQKKGQLQYAMTAQQKMKDNLIIVFDADEEPLLKDGQNKLNNEALDSIAMVLSYFRNQEMQTLLVTAGSIIAGIEKLNRHDYPKCLVEKQAVAAIGQVELIKRYQNIFDEYNHTIGQVLLARNITEIAKHRKNAKNTFAELFSLGIIPVINENDTVSTEDIEQETNFPLTATVANIVEADLIVRLNKDFSFDVITPSSKKTVFSKEDLFLSIKTFEPVGFNLFSTTL